MSAFSLRYATILSATLLTAALVGGCAAPAGPQPEVVRQRAAGVDLANYRSFAFFGAQPGSALAPLGLTRVQTAARDALEAQHYVYDPRHPDLLVNVFLRVDQVQDLSAVPAPALPLPQGMTDVARDGAVRVDLVDAERRELVWVGVVRGPIDDAAMREPLDRIDDAVAAIFDDFPGVD